jgi:hypothetical protein
MNRTRRNKEISRTAALGHRRSARSESQPQRVGKRSCDVEAMLDSLEIHRGEQLRRRRRERARRQKNRCANCAIIVIIGRNLHRRMRFGVSERCALRACRVRVLRYGRRSRSGAPARSAPAPRRAVYDDKPSPPDIPIRKATPRACMVTLHLLHQARGSSRPILNQHVSARVNSRTLVRIIAI